MVLSNRSTRRLLWITLGIIFLVYVPLNLLYIVATSSKQNLSVTEQRYDDQKALTEPKDKQRSNSDIGLKIKDIITDEVGNVDIVLNMDIKYLLKFLEKGYVDGEATSNDNPADSSILINNPKICDESKHMEYLVYVHTSPENIEKRDIMRKTWLNRSLFKERIIERVFLMGRRDDVNIQKKVKEESDKYGDIVQGNFLDNYKNLTLKALMGLKWVSNHCKKAKYIIKSDDDAFVHIFHLIHLLRQYEAAGRKKLLACALWKPNTMPILRDPAKCSKWCVKFTEFPGKRFFPQYCAGLTYILSNDVIPTMYNMSKTTPFFWIDDVYITGILASKVKNMDYQALRGNFTLKQDEGMTQLKNFKKPMTLLFVHVKKLDDYMLMWQLLLKRLNFDEVKVLGTDIVQSNEDLMKTLQNGDKQSKKSYH